MSPAPLTRPSPGQVKIGKGGCRVEETKNKAPSGVYTTPHKHPGYSILIESETQIHTHSVRGVTSESESIVGYTSTYRSR